MKKTIIHTLSRYQKFLAAIPVICCIITIGYLPYQMHQMNIRVSDETKLLQISKTVNNNKYFTEENSRKIDMLHQKVVEETINKFRSEDMQIWVKQFKEENPHLHIPDFILESQ